MLVNRYGNNLNSSILVAPHHGSKTSSRKTFINAVHPDIALFSTGYRNRYHFPHYKVVERYQQQDITMFNAATQGAIQFTFNSPLLLVLITTRQSTSRIWRSDATD